MDRLNNTKPGNLPEDMAEEGRGAFATLRQFVRRSAPRAVEAERCELCSAVLASAHGHLLELAKRQVVCACEPCSILFTSHAAPRFRRIPRDSRWLADFVLEDGQWESLSIPINLAFFFFSSAAGRVVACYPGPAGATESELHLDDWGSIVECNPILKKLAPDVEALLVNRISTANLRERLPEGIAVGHEYYLVPIDQCYRLAGVIRTHWRGLSGGVEVWKQIAEFFAELKRHSRETRCSTLSGAIDGSFS
jgi:hypothetical protein